jgi:predicted SnoaL-like aldol condensation-catalyzing enzyme
MSKKIENAKNLYLKGIRDWKIEVVREYTWDRYTQHSTWVKDGVEWFIDFFKWFIKRSTSRDIKIVRAIEDWKYVFVTAYQDINNWSAKWVTTDLFDTDDNEKIIEHWDVISAYVEVDKTVSWNDVVLWDFELKDLDKTEYNKSIIRSFMVDIFQNKNYKNLDKYITPNKYIEHSPNIWNGIESFRKYLDENNFTYEFIFRVIGQWNYVVSYSKVVSWNKDYAVFNIFRLKNWKIVEHWDNSEEILDRSKWGNSGKF